MEAKIKQDLRLIEALTFMWEHRSEMVFEMKDGSLMVGPAALARRYADTIRELRTQLVVLLETDYWSDSMARELYLQATFLCARMMKGRLVEVYNYAEFERTDLWVNYQATGEAIDEAGRDKGVVKEGKKEKKVGMKNYNRAILAHVDAHAAMLEAYNEDQKVAA